MLVFLLNSIQTLTKQKRKKIQRRVIFVIGGSFFLNQKKRRKPNERMDFAIFSYKKAMQLYFKSPIAPSMLLYR